VIGLILFLVIVVGLWALLHEDKRWSE